MSSLLFSKLVKHEKLESFIHSPSYSHLSNQIKIYNITGCGLSASSRLTAQRRIVGGTEAGFGSFPWQVRLNFQMLYTWVISQVTSQFYKHSSFTFFFRFSF